MASRASPRHSGSKSICFGGDQPEPSLPAHPIFNQRKTLLSVLHILHSSGILQHLSFCAWLSSHSTMFSRFVHVVSEFPSILWLSNVPSLYMPHCVYSFICRRALRLLPLRAIVNRAAVSTGVQGSAQVPACSSLGSIPRSGIAE